MISPPEPELTSALITLKAQNPTLGISKIHALLQSTYPSWTVSEKRTRKILQSHGLVLSSGGSGASAHTVTQPLVGPGSYKEGMGAYPSSRIMQSLDVGRWTTKVTVKYFDERKGKGLIATEHIKKGEVVWKEDPFVLAPEWCVLNRAGFV